MLRSWTALSDFALSKLGSSGFDPVAQPATAIATMPLSITNWYNVHLVKTPAACWNWYFVAVFVVDRNTKSTKIIATA